MIFISIQETGSIGRFFKEVPLYNTYFQKHPFVKYIVYENCFD